MTAVPPAPSTTGYGGGDGSRDEAAIRDAAAAREAAAEREEAEARTEDEARTEAEAPAEREARDEAGTREELAPGEVPVATVVTVWEAEVVDGYRDRWQQLQLRFIDGPRQAAGQAQALVADVCQGLTGALDRHRSELDRWGEAQLDDTEELRTAVRRYRDLLDRLLGL